MSRAQLNLQGLVTPEPGTYRHFLGPGWALGGEQMRERLSMLDACPGPDVMPMSA